MGTQVADALEALRSLGTPAEIWSLAERGYGPASAPRVNAHIHLPPNFSAFDSVKQAVTRAADEGIGVLGVNNYYDYGVYGEFAERARGRGIFPLFGLEIISMQSELREKGVKVNDPGNPGKTYICGKGITRFDAMTPEAKRLLDAIRKNDSERMAAMIDRMRATFRDRGVDANVDEQVVVEMVVRRHGSPREAVYLQERHISQAFQEELFSRTERENRLDKLNNLLGAAAKITTSDDSVSVQNEIRSQLMKAGKPAFVEETYLSFADAQRLILELGGIPCYPLLADGTSPLCEFEADPDQLVSELKARNIYSAEWIPVRNSTKIVVEYVTNMRKAGLVVTAGTEHNTLDLIAFDPTCKDGGVPAGIRDIFWEGACVVAAHQFLTLHGECGYVDRLGCPNPAFESDDARIKALAKIGAAVIQRYYDSYSTN